MLFNFMAIFSQFIIFVFGIAWLVESSIHKDSNGLYYNTIIYSQICKLAALFIKISMSYFGSIYLPKT